MISCSSRNDLTWNQETGYQWAVLDPGNNSTVGFNEMPSSQTNISFENTLSKEDMKNNFHYLNGSGVAAGDVDGDGWTDLYFTQLDGPNKLYKNLGGFEFKDITNAAGVAHSGYYSTGAVFADVDGDSDLDLFVSSMHKQNALYLNEGNGNFSLSQNSGLGEAKGSTTMALADIDEDEDLDLYITNYKETPANELFSPNQLALENIAVQKDDSFEVQSPFDQHYIVTEAEDGPVKLELGEQDNFFLNNGNGTFKKVANLQDRFLDVNGDPEGLYPDWGLTAKFQDINNDGLPDIYVCNDVWTPDRLWINQGKGIFRAVDPSIIRNYSFSSMGVDFSDVNRDGHIDLFVSEMLSQHHEKRLRQFTPDDPYFKKVDRSDYQPQYNRNSLYINRGDETFAETSYFSGLEASGWSWATHFLDVDLDGYDDLVINTGFTFDVQDMDAIVQLFQSGRQAQGLSDKVDSQPYPPLELSNKIFKNNQDLTFADKSSEWGLKSDDISHGLSSADLDHDGDLDLIINRLNEEAAVLENRVSSSRIKVRLIGKSPNTQAIGAKVKLQGGPGGPAPQQKEITAGGEYLSGSEPVAIFAADDENSNHIITVTWPDGRQSKIDSVKANRFYEIEESDIDKEAVRDSSSSATIFEDVSARIDHRHHEDSYNDFQVQPLLPYKLSRFGPGISWIDFDADGDDDLFIAAGQNGTTGAFENMGNGNFQEIQKPSKLQQAPGDQTTILGWKGAKGVQFLVGSANYGQGKMNPPSVYHYIIDGNQFKEQESLPGIFPSTGSLAAADYDRDGDLDIFAGGRFVPAHYPEDASSRLFKNENGQYELDEQNSEILDEIGLVTSAVFSDYDSDGDLDLILSREWDSIVLLENDNNTFRDVSSQLGLDSYKGWWQGIATGDFNNDGRPDIIATNMGLNTPYQLNIDQPLKMHYWDFGRDNRVDIIEARYDTVANDYVPIRQLQEFESMSSVMYKNIRSHEEFAKASLNQLLGYNAEDRLAAKEINTLSHHLFVNTENGYVAHPLPDIAQLAPAFSSNVADFNNDGNEDVFLSQNFFQVRTRSPRMDGGRGLWLEGDGEGNLRVIPGQISGIKVYGEQRGAALADFNGDAKVDLAVSQNSGATKLFKNQIPNPGLRIQLKGPEDNRNAIGSSIRLVYEDGSKGPRRELQAGSGYWSQNSTIQIMGYPKVPAQIEVTWYNGQINTVDVNENKNSFLISYSDSN